MDSTTDPNGDEFDIGEERELAKEFQPPEQIESSDYENVDDSSPLSLLSYADFCHNSFLNSIVSIQPR